MKNSLDKINQLDILQKRRTGKPESIAMEIIQSEAQSKKDWGVGGKRTSVIAS